MSDNQTPNLALEYLAPAQEQPEVLINDAWNKIDAFAGEIAGGIEIEQVAGPGDSPSVIVTGVERLRIMGATVSAESDGAALVDISGSGVALTVNDIDESPPATITDVAKITFRGATVVAESDSGALVYIDPQGVTIGATWVSAVGAITIPINDVLRFVGAKGRIIRATVLTEGGSGSCTIKLAKSNLSTGHFPPVLPGDDITGGHNIAIASSTFHDDSTLSDWSTLVAAGDVLLASLTANSTFTTVSLFLTLGHDT